ncbi:S-adenosyl-L-methionine-dependent methyltransferase [Thozetella sp. PMI_491]|nr:S-adenosyl-L-methionine-dependent methyltransferase [Thozetella sp. PMI_491]
MSASADRPTVASSTPGAIGPAAAGESTIGAIEPDSLTGGGTSLASSVLKYRVENGRTYHAYKEGSYILPNDAMENDRLDLQHACCLLTLDNKLYICPAGQDRPIKRVLDAGCGTGIWTLDFADEHPDAEVIGIDLSPIQPGFVPPNVAFYVDDLEADWAYNKPFDFIYMRMLSASIKDWQRLWKQAYDNLEPGGYLELLDPVYPMCSDDGTLLKDSAVYRWSDLLNQAATKLGSSLDSALSYKQQLTDAGFQNVTETVYKWPMFSSFTRALEWAPQQLEEFLVEVRKDLKNKNIHAYWKIVVVHGQKPTE